VIASLSVFECKFNIVLYRIALVVNLLHKQQVVQRAAEKSIPL